MDETCYTGLSCLFLFFLLLRFCLDFKGRFFIVIGCERGVGDGLDIESSVRVNLWLLWLVVSLR